MISEKHQALLAVWRQSLIDKGLNEKSAAAVVEIAYRTTFRILSVPFSNAAAINTFMERAVNVYLAEFPALKTALFASGNEQNIDHSGYAELIEMEVSPNAMEKTTPAPAPTRRGRPRK